SVLRPYWRISTPYPTRQAGSSVLLTAVKRRWRCVLVRVAERVRRGVAALQAHLVRPQRPELREEARVERHPPVLADVELRRPAHDALRVELLVPGRVERVREVDAPPVAADLHHLRAAVERAPRRRRVAR